MSIIRQPVVITLLAASAMALCGCSKGEVKTGSLTQRYTMVDAEGRQFGVVELDPINGGSVTDAQGRLVGRIVPPAPAAVASATPIANAAPAPTAVQ